MKIALVINELNVRGGTHKQVLRLCEYLVNSKHDVTIYTKYYDAEKTYQEFKQYKVLYLTDGEKKQNNKKGLLHKISRNFDDVKCDLELLNMIPDDTDIINIHDYGFLWLTLNLRKKKNSRVVWQVNDMPAYFRVGVAKEIEDSLGMKYKRILHKHACKNIDAITVNVTKNKELADRCLNCDAKVFYCGVDENKNLLPHTYDQMKDTVRILSTGVFFPYRNYETLVCAVEKLILAGKSVHLDIIGSTEWNPIYAKQISDMIGEKKLTDHITVWGQVDEATYNDLYNKANVFAFININQSWGLAVFEAMSCGLPVIVSNSVGAIELLTHNENAIILEPTDVEAVCETVINLVENKDYYNKISENATNIVKKFTWDKLYSSKMLELFQQLKK